jgi:metal-responsive CopG/Arc/MetJ family transcriptional regulator
MSMPKEIVEIPEELLLNIDDIKDQMAFETRQAFIVAAVKRLLDTYNQILIDNC